MGNYSYNGRLAGLGLGQDATTDTAAATTVATPVATAVASAPSLVSTLVSKLQTPVGLAVAAGALYFLVLKKNKTVETALRRLRRMM